MSAERDGSGGEGGLPPELEELLEAEKAAPAPAGRRGDELWSRLEVTLGLFPGGGGGAGGPHGGAGGGGHAGAGGAGAGTAAAGGAKAAAGAASGAAAGAASAAASGTGAASAAAAAAKAGIALAALKWAGVAAVATGLAVGGGAVYQARTARQAPTAHAPPAASAASIPRPEAPPQAPTSTPPAGPPSEVDASIGIPSVPVPPPAPAAAAASPPPPLPPAANGLRAEHNLLEQARAALARGDAEAALAAVETHASRFPLGQLAEERESLYVRALVLAHRGDEATARARAFFDAYPDSIHRGAVERALSR